MLICHGVEDSIVIILEQQYLGTSLFSKAKNQQMAFFGWSIPPFPPMFSSGGIPPPQIPHFLLSSRGNLSIFATILHHQLFFDDLQRNF